MQNLAILVLLGVILTTCYAYSIPNRLINIESNQVTDIESNRVRRSDDEEAFIDYNIFVVCTVTEACKKDEKNEAYIHPQCGFHPVKKYRTSCFVCRKVLKVCGRMEKYVHTVFGKK